MIKISVVIPTYKRSALLKRCLRSLLNQQFNKDEFEIIVVVDGNDSSSIPNINAQNLSYLFLNEKKGAAAARNLGWKSARGELIAFTDDDCITQNDLLLVYWSAYQSYINKNIAFTGKVIVPLSKQPTDYEKNIAHLETAEFVTANCACSKTVLQFIKGFDEDFKMAWREDSDLHFKLIENNISIKKIEDAVIVHPVRTTVFAISLKEQKKSMFNSLLFKKHPELYKERISNKPVWRYYLMIITMFIGVIFLLIDKPVISIVLIITWFLQVILFTIKRLKNTSHSLKHVSEMLITSGCIPFLSIYWTLYGSFRYKIWFL